MKSFFKKSVRQIVSPYFLGVFFAVVMVFNVIPSMGFVVFDQFSPVPVAEAEDTPTTTATAEAKSLQETLNTADSKSTRAKIADFASLFVGLFVPLIAVLVNFIGVLMGDDYIFGNNSSDGSNIADLLYKLWDIVRTIVNYGFLLMLLFYAVMNIVPWGTDSFQIKTVLPHLVLAIVVVNMTWFGVRVVFDVVDVTARIVYGLPQAVTVGDGFQIPKKCVLSTEPDISKIFDESTGEPVSNIPKEDGKHVYAHGCNPEYVDVDWQKGLSPVAIDATKTDTSLQERIDGLKKQAAEEESAERKKALEEKAKKYESIKSDVQDEGGVIDYGTMTIYWRNFDHEKFDQSSIAQLFAFSIMQIQNLPRTADLNKLNNIENGKLGDIKMDDGWTALFINTVASFIIMILIGLLFIMMMINLFFRIIILWANIIASPFMAFQLAWKGPGAGSNPASEYLSAASFLKHAFAPVIMGIPLVIGFIMISVGKSYGYIENVSTGNVEFAEPLIDGVSDVHQLFFYFLAIAVLWMGGVKAIEATTAEFVSQTFINPIKTGVQNIAGAIAKAPLYMQFIPVGDINGDKTKDKMSLNNIFGDIPNTFGNALKSKSDANYSSLFQQNLSYYQDIEQRINKNTPHLWKTFKNTNLKSSKIKDAMDSGRYTESSILTTDSVIKDQSLRDGIAQNGMSLKEFYGFLKDKENGGTQLLKSDSAFNTEWSQLETKMKKSTPTAPATTDTKKADAGPDKVKSNDDNQKDDAAGTEKAAGGKEGNKTEPEANGANSQANE